MTDGWHRFDALGHRRTARLREALRAWKSPLHWAQVSHCLSETLCIELKYASGCCHLFLHSFEQNLRYDSNKALLADQWYYILYFVSWSASLNQRKRHHRKGACCWQRQGKLWGSMSIRRGARTSWAHIFVYIDSKAPRQCFGLLFTFRKVFDLLVTEGVIQARLQWLKEILLWPIFCAIQSCNFRLHHFIPPVFWD